MASDHEILSAIGEGESFPLGVSRNVRNDGWNFALYSKHASSVTLQLFAADDWLQPVLQVQLDYREQKSGPLWHCDVPEQLAPSAAYYCYRVEGPSPGRGFEWHSFDAEKLLIDPYARAIFFPPDFDREAARAPGTNLGHAPLAVLPRLNCPFDWNGDRRIRHQHDLVIYEMHVRGFTYHASSGVRPPQRGAFAGVIEKIPYLQELGITAVELMPIFQCDPQDDQYWGYMPISFFSPHHLFSHNPHGCEQKTEFQEMVKALHRAGIEVILDVVFNHTGEGDQSGPTYTFKGIDNSTYYLVTGDPQHPFQNFSGTGNTLHTANRAVRQLIVDSLRYWVTEMHVDGFRFDLASVFTRERDGSVSPEDPPIFGQIAADPNLTDIRLIAEPWDAGGAYQLGRKFPGQLWMQWNARYRDTLQRFVRGDQGLVGDLMTRLYGSTDLFPDDRMNACRPWQTVNYVVSHDGSTLYDLVAYNQRNNWANGHQNQDGPDEFSYNCGWEGDTGVSADVLKLRKRLVKNHCCLLMLSAGTPMFRMGDEMLQTQGGNNNPYNQDNETTWLDWSKLEQHADTFRFFKSMIAFRKRHPMIGRSHFWREDIHWFGADREVDLSPQSQTLAYWLRGDGEEPHDLYVMINAAERPRTFGIFAGAAGQWLRAVDTGQQSPDDIPDEPPTVSSNFYDVAERSIVVLIRPV